MLTAFAASDRAGAMATSEYQLKAVFLFNFAQFVEWPPHAFAAENDPLGICVVGPDPFGNELEAVMEGEQISGRPIALRRFERAADMEGCHLVFVGRTAEGEMRNALARVQGEPVLTVGETEEFIANGGMIRFFTEQNRVRLQINPDAADEAHLRVSSKLLRSSQIVAKVER